MNKLLTAMISLVLLLQIGNMFRAHLPSISWTSERTVWEASDGELLDLTGVPMQGSRDAKVVLAEFSDYECPFCARHATGVGVEIYKRYVETGKIRRVFLNNPLDIHSNAKLLATAALCAGNQDRYWEMHDRLFRDSPKSETELLRLVPSLSLDSEQFKECLASSPSAEGRIEDDMLAARRFELAGTPGFAVGVIDATGRLRVRKLLVGAQNFEVFESLLDEVIEENS